LTQHAADRHAFDVADGLRFDERANLRARSGRSTHRVADREERAPVAVDPAGHQPADQLEVRVRRVLELVDEQMIDAHVQAQQQVRRRVVLPQRAERREGRLREVELACLRKYGFEVRGELGKQ
jgi:hypothetical protein